MKYLNKITEIEKIAEENDCLGVITLRVTRDPKFAVWSGCSQQNRHHYGEGGLQYHTWEVISLCMENAKMVESFGNPVDKTTLFYAALYHDLGKIWDYAPLIEDPELAKNHGFDSIYTEWKSTPHKRQIHHISRSGIEWSKTVARLRDRYFEEKVLHCILSHHGTREWGSPVAPLTREAWLLFLCDGISARANDCDKYDMVGKVKNV